jgi:hypothetical protein
MTIELNPEQERVVGQAIQEGLIRAADDAIEVGIATIRQNLGSRSKASYAHDAERWFGKLQAWSESHTTKTPLLPDETIDRDSIYGARGL